VGPCGNISLLTITHHVTSCGIFCVKMCGTRLISYFNHTFNPLSKL